MQEAFWFALREIGKFWILFFLWMVTKVGYVSGHLGSSYLALGANSKMTFFDSMETRL